MDPKSPNALLVKILDELCDANNEKLSTGMKESLKSLKALCKQQKTRDDQKKGFQEIAEAYSAVEDNCETAELERAVQVFRRWLGQRKDSELALFLNPNPELESLLDLIQGVKYGKWDWQYVGREAKKLETSERPLESYLKVLENMIPELEKGKATEYELLTRFKEEREVKIKKKEGEVKVEKEEREAKVKKEEGEMKVKKEEGE